MQDNSTDYSKNFNHSNSNSHQQSNKSSWGLFKGCLIFFLLITSLPTFFFIAFFTITFFFIGNADFTDGFSDKFSAIVEDKFNKNIVRQGDWGNTNQILLIPVTGAITGNGSSYLGSGNMFEITEQLDKAIDDTSVQVVILQIDSPGGGLTASDLIYEKVKKLKESGKLVVAWISSIGASGAYYIIADSEKIFASPTALIGSIGVILTRFQVEGLLQKIGVKYEPVMSGENKDFASPFHDLTEYERKYLETQLDGFHKRFINIVAKGRGLEFSDVEKIADGKVYTVEQALDYKLIDEIGYMDDVLKYVEDKVGIQNMTIVTYQRKFSFADLLVNAESKVVNQVVSSLQDQSSAKVTAKW